VTPNQGWSVIGVYFEVGDYVNGSFVKRTGQANTGIGTFNAATGEWKCIFDNNPAGSAVVRAYAQFKSNLSATNTKSSDADIAVR
jgi:hypothetical protein